MVGSEFSAPWLNRLITKGLWVHAKGFMGSMLTLSP